MTRLQDFNLSELGIFLGVVSGAIVSILLATQKSKCKKCCFGCIERDVDAVIAEERLQATGRTGATPRKPYLIKENRTLELEPEPEPSGP